MNDDLSTAVGPGLVEERLPEGKSLIQGYDDTQYVEIHNPLTVDFVGQVGMTKNTRADMPIGGANDPESTQMTRTEPDVRNTYGFDLRSAAQATGKVHIKNKIRIPAGQSLKLFGGEAQVIAMQMVTVILQQEGHSNINDPALREEAERRIILSTGNIREQMATAAVSERDQLASALAQMNDNSVHTNVISESSNNVTETEFADAILTGTESDSTRAQTFTPATAQSKRVDRASKEA